MSKKLDLGKAIPYDIVIKPSMNKGFIVTVGCSTTVFADGADLLEGIREYIEDPVGLDKKYNEAIGGGVFVNGGVLKINFAKGDDSDA
jgi:hypothetical protein